MATAGLERSVPCSTADRMPQWVEQDLTRRFTGRILVVDLEVTMRWGAITATAERQGRPVPVLDGLLAATALVAGLTLVTRNTPHMQATGVQLFDPWSI